MINKSQLEGQLKSMIDERKYKSTNLTVFISHFSNKEEILSVGVRPERTVGFPSTHYES